MGMVDLHPVQSGRLTYPCSVNELLYQLVQLFLRKIIRSLWTASVDSLHSLQSAVTDLGHNPAASPCTSSAAWRNRLWSIRRSNTTCPSSAR